MSTLTMETIEVCKIHKNKMPCNRLACDSKSVIEPIEIERMTIQDFIQFKEKERGDLISKYEVTNSKLQCLINDLCMKDATDAYNIPLIDNALDGMYSDFDSEEDGVVTLVEHCILANYKDMHSKIVRGEYDHGRAPTLIGS